MGTDRAEIRVRGKTLFVPSTVIEDRTVVVTGTWLRIAEIKDQAVVNGEPVQAPETFIAKLRASGLQPDIFTFAQKLPDTTPKFKYPYRWDNWAAARTTSFEGWWESLPQESRKNVRRAGKRGVEVRVVPFDDELVKGIHAIYNETPIRQGRPFWHYGKDFETVKREHATYLERSEFIGAYHEGKLVGFIKMVYVDKTATLFQIFADEAQHDKRPMNALVAKTVEVCASKGIDYLLYGKYTYGNKTNSPLAEFKRRNGFEEVRFPKYFVPLTFKGAIALKLRAHLSLREILPPGLLIFIVGLRARAFRVIQTAMNAGRGRSKAA